MDFMSNQEKNIYASLVTTAIVYAFYVTKLHWLYIAGEFNKPDSNELLGQAILIYIVASIIVHILVNIIFSIANMESMKECEVIDERDKLFELKTESINSIFFGISFCISIVFLAIGTKIFWVINIMVFGFVVGGITSNFVKLYYYRKGL